MQEICYKNANILSLQRGKLQLRDILVSDGKISKIAKGIDFKGKSVDLEGGIVVPSFVNVFCQNFRAFEKTYGKIDAKNFKNSSQRAEFSENIENLMKIKNYLAGASIFNDVKIGNPFNSWLAEDLSEMDEKDLLALSCNVAQNKQKLFLRAGGDLNELGIMDRTYKKPLSQVLEDFGILDRKPVIVGGNCFEKDELSLLAQYDCDFCITPSEDGKFGRRPTNLVSLNSMNFKIGIGSGYSFEVDFFGFMRQILMTQRGLFEDENCLSEQDVLKMATVVGGKILTGRDTSIKELNDANFFVLKNTPSLYDDIFKTIVWEKSKKDVTITVKNGEIVQKNGKIVSENLPTYDKIIETIIRLTRRK